MNRRSRRTSILAAALLAAAVSSPVAASGLGPPHDGFYVDGVVYRTIGTPTDLSTTGAPAASFEALYEIQGQSLAVAAAGPGDPGFRGGRWMRFLVTWNTTPYLLTSAEAVLAAATAGDVTIASTPDAIFECPVIRG